jgi:transcriptional regulator with XRE-family HTH domain
MKHRNLIGSRIQKLRSQKHWSQEQLTTKLQVAGLDISRSAVAKIENGQQAVFDYQVLFFQRVFKVDAAFFQMDFDPRDLDFSAKVREYMEGKPRNPGCHKSRYNC